MEHRFTGPAYTVGIEEELMILDGSTLDLVNAIESLLEPAEVGEIKPELMESVLESQPTPARTSSRPRSSCGRCDGRSSRSRGTRAWR